jgi:hypothetical protein
VFSEVALEASWGSAGRLDVVSLTTGEHGETAPHDLRLAVDY